MLAFFKVNRISTDSTESYKENLKFLEPYKENLKFLEPYKEIKKPLRL